MSEKTARYDLTEGSIFRKMLRYALPIFFGSLFQSLYTTADAVILGRFEGKGALAAIESVFSLTRIPVNLFVGIGLGASVLLAQAFGAKQEEEISRTSHTAVMFSIVGGVMLAALGCLVSPFAIRLVQVPAEIVGEAQVYLTIYFIGIAASLVFNVSSGIFRALGDSHHPFIYLVVANIVNTVLDVVLIGLLRWGVSGAAAATAVSQFVCAFLVFNALRKTDLPCRISLSGLRMDRRILKRVLALGFPTGIQSAMYPFANTVVQTAINSFGVNAIAAWAITGKLDFLVWSISESFGATVATFVGQNTGAKKSERVRAAIKVGLMMTLGVVGLISVLLYFWGASVGTILVQDAEVIALIGAIFRFVAPAYWLYVPIEIFSSAIRGVGDTIRPMIISMVSIMLFRILWIWAAVPFRPTLLMTLACFPLSWAIATILYSLLLIFHPKLNLKALPK